MNNVNKTLYIPLYGKARVSKLGLFYSDPTAESVWERESFPLKGKSASKWLAYYMAMRSAAFDRWAEETLREHPEYVVLHIGCGMDSRVRRIGASAATWYDIDFPEVIGERKKYFSETETYRMLSCDMRSDSWKEIIPENRDTVVILEGVSMYFTKEELTSLFSSLCNHAASLSLSAASYTVGAAKASKYKNPINDVGVTTVYGWDHPEDLAAASGMILAAEHSLTPEEYIIRLPRRDQWIFRHVFAGSFANKLYRLYEFRK